MGVGGVQITFKNAYVIDGRPLYLFLHMQEKKEIICFFQTQEFKYHTENIEDKRFLMKEYALSSGSVCPDSIKHEVKAEGVQV